MILPHRLKNKVFQSAFIFLFLGSQLCFAQREVMFEQYVQNPMAINPAFTGVRETFNMTAMFRRKWINIPNSPSSQTFAADGTFGNGKFGAGFQALNDQTSYFTTTALSASFAYHLGISDKWKLGVGAQGGINVLPVFDISGNTNRALASAGVGAWLHSDQFYLGISKPEILSHGFGDQVINYFYRRPLYIMTGGSYELDEDVLLLPHILIVQEKDHNLRVDLGARLWFNEKVGVGASYRMGGKNNVYSDAGINFLQLSAEVQLGKNVRLGYFYSTKQIEQLYTISQGPKGIHELMLKFVPNPSGFQKY
ncbi:PorP/SprF family type IX secretion system membrane protein [Dyadobacter psychrotolerans]|uniref:Type IX secretion system membrane protein PorP/SprF n=1 Tax=Dyadobacter psychrotolerans TaxID=2541721 RepID=A0A4R5DKH8_9BACT|nr:PorP/SprF family type IX secretion system membrane protein [Dyadobacter psychrotolerans]TDE11345.1 type IX secretion system membrane protein PorP/SprF [Dyadobacter psychrotolerans]